MAEQNFSIYGGETDKLMITVLHFCTPE